MHLVLKVKHVKRTQIMTVFEQVSPIFLWTGSLTPNVNFKHFFLPENMTETLIICSATLHCWLVCVKVGLTQFTDVKMSASFIWQWISGMI